MSTLNSLKLVNSKKPTAIPPILHRRNKLGSKVWEQILQPRRHLPFYGAVIMEVVIEDCENENNKKSN